jgi:hypothetical protein
MHSDPSSSLHLAREGMNLYERLYNRSMDAAIQGDRALSDRLARVASLAMVRYTRRLYAYRRSAQSD